jgi:hypothetical protein
MEISHPQPQTTPPQPLERLLLSRREAATMLGISARSLDYLVANKQLLVRRIGKRVMISMVELRRFSRGDHQTKPN